MSRHIALLRGINVGGRTVKMADLRECFEEMGFEDVSTLLQTGNVTFEATGKVAGLKTKIQKGLSDRFGYDAKVQVLKRAQLTKIIDGYPFGSAGDSQHDYVIFMEDGLEKKLVKEDVELAKGEKVEAGRGVVYWRVDKGSTLKSSFSKLLSKAKYKDFNTNRNLNTVRKLAATPEP